MFLFYIQYSAAQACSAASQTRFIHLIDKMGNKLSVPVVDLSGKVAIVTGGNTGIGYELVRGLAEMGATVIMASRSEDRATSVSQ